MKNVRMKTTKEGLSMMLKKQRKLAAETCLNKEVVQTILKKKIQSYT